MELELYIYTRALRSLNASNFIYYDYVIDFCNVKTSNMKSLQGNELFP